MTDTNFSDSYANFLTQFNPKLEEFLAKTTKEVEGFDRYTKYISQAANELILSGGKRLRPYLVYLGHQISGGTPEDLENVFRCGLIIEIFHTFACIHDDIIDQSDTRRNTPTVHKQFEKIHQTNDLKSTPQHFGSSMAILTGDLLFAVASNIFNSIDTQPEIKDKLFQTYSQMFMNLILGEYQDVYLSFLKTQPSEEEIMHMLRWKSGEYTIEFPLKFGATLAGAGAPILDFLSDFATPLGIAFQLKDDLMGIFGESDEIGKSNLSDIREGKNTLIIYEVMQKSSPAQIEILNRILGNPKADVTDLETVREIITQTGVKQLIEDRITKSVEDCVTLVSKAPISNSQQKILTEFASFVINRRT